MKICVLAGMIDEKLSSKLRPLQESELVERIYLIRRKHFSGKKLRCYSTPWLSDTLKLLAEFYRFICLVWVALRHRPDCLIAFGTIPHGIYSWLIGSVFRIPVIQHVMGKNDLRLTYPEQSFRATALKAVRSARFIAVRGMATRAWLLEQKISPDKIFVPQNLHDFDLFRPIPTIKKQYDLIYVGLLAGYKRLDLMLSCIARTRTTLPGIRLLIVGDGAMRDTLKTLCQTLDIEKNVIFYGSSNFNQLSLLYNQAKAFIMTSQGEGLPMAMIEALSCGLPVIVADDADITDLAINGYNACVVSSEHMANQGLHAMPAAADNRADKLTDYISGNIASETADTIVDKFSHCCIRLLTDPDFYQTLSTGAISIRTEKRKAYSLQTQSHLWEQHLRQCQSDQQVE